MAKRNIPPQFLGGRIRTTNEARDLIFHNYGPIRQYGPCPYPLNNPLNIVINTGGSSMTALLGPDLGDGQRRGTATTTGSLQPVMGLLRSINPQKTWVAGHLLNAELGGSGTFDLNLTPLTHAANMAHKTFEGHIKRMLVLCRQIDQYFPAEAEWYGVLYQIVVSPLTYSAVPATNDMHSYAYSHMTLNYRFVKLPKFPIGIPHHTQPPPPNAHGPVGTLPAPVDARLAQLQGVTLPVFAGGANIANWAAAPNGISFSVEIHNEP